MKHSVFTTASLLALAFPLGLFAQPTTNPPTTTVSAEPSSDFSPFEPQQGSQEFSIGGSGATNKGFDNSFGGVSVAYGYYFNGTLEGAVRQSINYTNPDVGGTKWNGATRIALDQHVFPSGRVRPFVGVNFGGVYGDNVRDTWAAGLETGAKFYIQPRTFIVATVEYAWFFEHAHSLDNRFKDGQFNWSLGVGFNF